MLYDMEIFVDFGRFLIHDNYEVLYTWCLKGQFASIVYVIEAV